MVLLIGDDLLAGLKRGSLLVVHLLWSVRHTRWAHSSQAPDMSFRHHPQTLRATDSVTRQ